MRGGGVIYLYREPQRRTLGQYHPWWQICIKLMGLRIDRELHSINRCAERGLRSRAGWGWFHEATLVVVARKLR